MNKQYSTVIFGVFFTLGLKSSFGFLYSARWGEYRELPAQDGEDAPDPRPSAVPRVGKFIYLDFQPRTVDTFFSSVIFSYLLLLAYPDLF